MKKLLVAATAILLAACGAEIDDSSENQQEVLQGEPREVFYKVGSSEIGGYSTTKFVDMETGCYYIRANGVQAVSVTPMFVEKDGVTVPYCEGE